MTAAAANPCCALQREILTKNKPQKALTTRSGCHVFTCKMCDDVSGGFQCDEEEEKQLAASESVETTKTNIVSLPSHMVSHQCPMSVPWVSFSVLQCFLKIQADSYQTGSLVEEPDILFYFNKRESTLSTHHSADGGVGEVFVSTKHFWSFRDK